jgi:hypothetical protein
MNKFIANTFSGVLSLLHLLFIGGLVLALISYHQNKQSLVAFFGHEAAEPVYVYVIALVVFLGYVLVLGALSTLVSINEYLKDISKKIDRLNANS